MISKLSDKFKVQRDYWVLFKLKNNTAENLITFGNSYKYKNYFTNIISN